MAIVGCTYLLEKVTRKETSAAIHAIGEGFRSHYQDFRMA